MYLVKHTEVKDNYDADTSVEFNDYKSIDEGHYNESINN